MTKDKFKYLSNAVCVKYNLVEDQQIFCFIMMQSINILDLFF